MNNKFLISLLFLLLLGLVLFYILKSKDSSVLNSKTKESTKKSSIDKEISPKITQTNIQSKQNTESLKKIDSLIETALSNNVIPGCTLLIGRKDYIILKENAYGFRSLTPNKSKTNINTIYDLASITKPIATATSIMILMEKNKLNTLDNVSKHIPEFIENKSSKKTIITIKHLLTHTSGIPNVHFDSKEKFSDKHQYIINKISASSIQKFGKFKYNCINYILLEEIIYRITEQRIDAFAKEHIFTPLGMNNTFFNPDPTIWNSVAPTQRKREDNTVKVQDPKSRFLDGISGNAGLFSTVKDLSKYCQMILNKGIIFNNRILKESTVKNMTTDQCMAKSIKHGYGWFIKNTNEYTYPKSKYFSNESFGHTGYSGTALWIDPINNFYFIFLSNVHHGKKQSILTRKEYHEYHELVGNIADQVYLSYSYKK